MKSKKIVEHINIEDSIDEIDPPGPSNQQSSNSVEEWLSTILETEKPDVAIDRFGFGIFESQKDRILFLVGLNRYGNSEKVDFKPKNMYFRLPLSDYEGLTRDQLFEKISAKIRNLANSQKFDSSFLFQSKAILLDGKTIWTK